MGGRISRNGRDNEKRENFNGNGTSWGKSFLLLMLLAIMAIAIYCAAAFMRRKKYTTFDVDLSGYGLDMSDCGICSEFGNNVSGVIYV